jgi:hypothetical protein
MKAIELPEIWRTQSRDRWFLLPAAIEAPEGPDEIRSLSGQRRSVSLELLRVFEITEAQGRRLARDQLSEALEELRRGIDAKVSEWRSAMEARDSCPERDAASVAPAAIGACLELLRQLPRIVGRSISGDQARVSNARDTMAKLQQQLFASGIDLDSRFTEFPDRLAQLRVDSSRKSEKARGDGDSPQDES